MTVMLDLPPDLEAQLHANVAREGRNADAVLLDVMRLGFATKGSVPSHAPVDEATIALLDAFEQSDEYGTAEEQQETLGILRRAIDEDRPGQRSIFGQGINP